MHNHYSLGRRRSQIDEDWRYWRKNAFYISVGILIAMVPILWLSRGRKHFHPWVVVFGSLSLPLAIVFALIVWHRVALYRLNREAQQLPNDELSDRRRQRQRNIRNSPPRGNPPPA